MDLTLAIQEAMKTMNVEQKQILLNLLTEKNKLRSYNKLNHFKAYDFQKRFYAASADKRFRFLCAANRVGKSYSEAYEVACHLTGRYPEWWTGHKFKKPILCWAVGITGDSTRKVLQKELFGTAVGKDADALGTGAIPRDCIDFNTLEKDGNKILICQVKHHNARGEFDGLSTLEFRSTQQGEHALMGATVDYIWLDEEDPYRSMEIFAQCVTRTLTTKGLVTLTATPENGKTKLVKRFMGESDDEAGSLEEQEAEGKLDDVGFEDSAMYWQNATWWDAHESVGGHISDKDIADMTAGIPDWQLDMRSKGIPMLGSGLIYDIDPDRVKCEPFSIPDHWRQVAAVDIGHTHPTAVVWTAYDQEHDVIYVTDVYRQTGAVPADHALAINGRGRWIPVVLPHDSVNTERGSGQSVVKYYKDASVNVLPETFYNPIGYDGKRNYYVDTGITELLSRMRSGRLKVFHNCHEIFQEMRDYHRKDGKIVKEDDDAMDAMRYSVMSVTHRGKSKKESADGYSSAYSANVSRWNNSY